jgi:hypothetical protein
MHFGYGFYIHDYSFLSLSLSLSLINSDPVWQQLPPCLPGFIFFLFVVMELNWQPSIIVFSQIWL